MIKHKQDNQPIKTVEEIELETRANKQILLDLRSDAENRVVEIDKLDFSSKQYVDQSEALFHDIASEIKAFLAKLFHDAELEIGAAPCEYAVIGLGSLALEQATPFSDLEFAILTENRDYIFDADPKVRDYFRNLTYLVHFKVINLGETTIPKSRYGVDLDSMFKPAIMFDSGGKTALGREDKSYDLIQTVDGMMSYVKNFGARIEHLDKNLPNILMQTCYIYGNESLAIQYKYRVAEFLSSYDRDGSLVCEARAIGLLTEEVVEINYFKSYGMKIQIKSDLDKFAPLNRDLEGKLFDVKQEIYRLPDRLLYNLGLYHNINSKNLWGAIDKLKEMHIISENGAKNLSYALTFAILLRLKIYLKHCGQVEDLSLFPIASKTGLEDVTKVFRLSQKDLSVDGALFKYYHVTLPFYDALEKFCKSSSDLSVRDRNKILSESDFFRNNNFTNGLVCYRIMRWSDAKSFLEDHLETEDLDIDGGLTLAWTYRYLGEYSSALQIMHEILSVCHVFLETTKSQYISTIFSKVGVIYSDLARYQEAAKYFNKSLEILLEFYPQNYTGIAVILNNLANTYSDLGNYKDAFKFYEQSLEILRKQSDVSMLDYVHVLSNIASTYSNFSQYDKALEIGQRQLEILHRFYKGEDHPDIADTLCNMSLWYLGLHRYVETDEYAQKSLKMKKEIYQDILHPDLASSFMNIANIYGDLSRYDEALDYNRQALKILEQIHTDYPHPTIAVVLINIATLNIKLHKYDHNNRYYDEALAIYQRALEMVRSIYNTKNHPMILNCLIGIGNAYSAWDKYDQSLEVYQEALSMSCKVYGNDSNVILVLIFTDMGVVLMKVGQYEKAAEYYERALEILRINYGDVPRKDTAACLYNLGITKYLSWDYDEALRLYMKSIEISEKVYGSRQHLEVSNVLNNIGMIYNIQGRYKEALECFQESLGIKHSFYRDGLHPHIAQSLKNIAIIYHNLGQAQQMIGKSDLALGYYQESIKAIKKIHGDKHLDIIEILVSIAQLYITVNQREKILECLRDGILILGHVDLKGVIDPNIAKLLNGIGNIYIGLGDLHEALKYFDQALNIRKKIYKDCDHWEIADSLTNIGLVHRVLGNYTEALHYHEGALKIMKEFSGNKPHPYIASSLNNISLVYRNLGDHHSAFKAQLEAFQMRKNLFGDIDHPDMAASMMNLANLYSQKEKYKKALELYNQSLEMRKNIYGDRIHPEIATVLMNIGNVLNAQGLLDNALEYYLNALEMREKIYGDRPHLEMAQSYLNLGSLSMKTGNICNAKHYFELARNMMSSVNSKHEMMSCIHKSLEQIMLLEVVLNLMSSDIDSDLSYGGLSKLLYDDDL